MLYFIEPVDLHELASIIQNLVDFSWDSEQICIARYSNGLLVDFGEPLGTAVNRLGKRTGKSVRPVTGNFSGNGWQVLDTHASPED